MTAEAENARNRSQQITFSGSAARALVETLHESEITSIFASPGSEWAPFWEAMAQVPFDFEYRSVGHEELAVSMAMGYAKLTGRVPGVLLHTTVGVLHASMALRAALHEQVPLVVLAGESIGFGETEGPDPGGQWLSHLADMGGPSVLVERCVKWSSRVLAPELLPSMVRRAVHLARQSPPGPVVLSVPMEVMFAEIDVALTLGTSRPTMPDTAALEQLASDLETARRPLIVTEEAGRDRDSVKDLVEIAEIAGARVVETRGTRFMNFPRRHPLHSGFDPRSHLDDADVVLLLGVLAPWHPSSHRPTSVERMTAIRSDPMRGSLPYWGYQVDDFIDASLAPSLRLLRKALEDTSLRDDSHRERVDAIREENQLRRMSIREYALQHADRSPIHPRFAALVLGENLPTDVVVVDETVTPRRGLLELIDHLEPGSFFAGAIGGLGTGLGTALGIKSQLPDRPVVCTIGDGSLGYEPGLAAFGAAQQLGLSLLIVVMNNAGYLSQKATIPKYFPRGEAVAQSRFPGMDLTPAPDLALVARAHGGDGAVVEEPRLLGEATRAGLDAISQGKTFVLDIRLQEVATLTRRED